MPGSPASEGSSSTSTEAKNASMSTWRITLSAVPPLVVAEGSPRFAGPAPDRSPTEGQPPEPFGKGNTRLPARFLGTTRHRGGGPLHTVGELAAMAPDRFALDVHRPRDVDPDVGLECPRQEHGAHLVAGPGGGEVERQRRGRGHGVEPRQAEDAVITVVEVPLAEEDRGGVGAQHDLGAEPAHRRHQQLAELMIVAQFAVWVPEELLAGQPDHSTGLSSLSGPPHCQCSRIDVGIHRALASIGAQQDPYLAPRLGPSG